MRRTLRLVFFLFTVCCSVAFAATRLTREQYLATFVDKNLSIDATKYNAADIWTYVQTVPAK